MATIRVRRLESHLIYPWGKCYKVVKVGDKKGEEWACCLTDVNNGSNKLVTELVTEVREAQHDIEIAYLLSILDRLI